MEQYCFYRNNVCQLMLVGQQSELHAIHFINKTNIIKPQENWLKNEKIFRDINRQLDLYFAKKLIRFNVSFAIHATDFEMKVYNMLQQILYGNTMTYGDLANAINNRHASRAVGKAANKNPLPIIIPCHRLIGSKGDLIGFSGGLSLKRKLLLLEGISL